MSAPLSDYSTQAARADELRRRKLARELLKDWQRAREIIDAEGVANVRAITDEEWAAAVKADEEGEAQ